MSSIIQREWTVTGDLRQALDRLGAYLLAVGYLQDRSAIGKEQVFSRSSAEMSLIGINPRQWGCTVRVNPFPEGEATRVVVGWHIATTGQLITRHDVAYFKAEIAAAESALKGTESRIQAAEDALQQARRLMAVFLILSLVGGVPLGFFVLEGYEWALPIFAVAFFLFCISCLVLRQPGGLKALAEPNTQAE